MIHEYIQKLMENLPDNMTTQKKPVQIDLILGGGAFNGSYILGALYFLKELERRQLVVVRRISTCSISSILGLLYLTDHLDKANELYFDIIRDFKHNGNLSKLFHCKHLFQPCFKDDKDCQMLRKKLYISYNNIQTRKKRVKYYYTDIDDLFEIITRSCFVPFMIDFSPAYKNAYIDGILPYFFPKTRRTRLYLNVYTIDKLAYTINIKNEKNNYHRLFEGMLDIHEFFIKQTNTTMCSNVDRWGCYQYILYYTYTVLEKIAVYIIYLVTLVKSHILVESYDTIKPVIEHFIKYALQLFCF